MKSVPVPQHPFLASMSKMATVMLVLMMVFATSCQKDPEIVLQERQASEVQATVRSSADLEQQVVQHTQWLLDHVAPLVSDAAVAAALESGNPTAAVVTAKLQELGYSSFEQFAQAFINSGSAVQSAISSGSLTQSQLLQIVQNHTFDYSAIGGAASNLPCTTQLGQDLAQLPIVVALAASSGPWSAVIAGAVHVGISYVSFKNCLRTTYSSAP